MVNLADAFKRDGKGSMKQQLGDVVGGGNMDAARGRDPITGTPNVLETWDKFVATKPDGCTEGSANFPDGCAPATLTGNASLSGEAFDLAKLQGQESDGRGAWCTLGWNAWGHCNEAVSQGAVFPKPGPVDSWRGGTFRMGTKFDNVKLLGSQQADRQLVLQSAPWTTSTDWSGREWTSGPWTANRWSANRWAGSRWVTANWLASNWDANRWAGNRWFANRWAGAGWVDFAWS